MEDDQGTFKNNIENAEKLSGQHKCHIATHQAANQVQALKNQRALVANMPNFPNKAQHLSQLDQHIAQL